MISSIFRGHPEKKLVRIEVQKITLPVMDILEEEDLISVFLEKGEKSVHTVSKPIKWLPNGDMGADISETLSLTITFYKLSNGEYENKEAKISVMKQSSKTNDENKKSKETASSYELLAWVSLPFKSFLKNSGEKFISLPLTWEENEVEHIGKGALINAIVTIKAADIEPTKKLEKNLEKLTNDLIEKKALKEHSKPKHILTKNSANGHIQPFGSNETANNLNAKFQRNKASGSLAVDCSNQSSSDESDNASYASLPSRVSAVSSQSALPRPAAVPPPAKVSFADADADEDDNDEFAFKDPSSIAKTMKASSVAQTQQKAKLPMASLITAGKGLSNALKEGGRQAVGAAGSLLAMVPTIHDPSPPSPPPALAPEQDEIDETHFLAQYGAAEFTKCAFDQSTSRVDLGVARQLEGARVQYLGLQEAAMRCDIQMAKYAFFARELRRLQEEVAQQRLQLDEDIAEAEQLESKLEEHTAETASRLEELIVAKMDRALLAEQVEASKHEQQLIRRSMTSEQRKLRALVNGEPEEQQPGPARNPAAQRRRKATAQSRPAPAEQGDSPFKLFAKLMLPNDH